MEKTGTFEEDLEVGMWKSYDRAGKLSMAGEYKDGQMHGPWKVYSQGKVISTTVYNEGVKISN